MWQRQRTTLGEGGTPHILCWGGDTAQHLQKKLSCGRVGMGGWSKPENNATLWLHLSSWNLPDSQLNWESEMEPSGAKREKKISLQENFCPKQLLDPLQFFWCQKVLVLILSFRIAMGLLQTFLVRIGEICYWKFERFSKNALTRSIFELDKCSF